MSLSDAEKADLRNQEILGIQKECAMHELQYGEHMPLLGRCFSPSHERIEMELDETLEPNKIRWLRFKQRMHKLIPFICWPKFHHRSGANVYSECPVCLRREVKVSVYGYSPIDVAWLKATGNCSLLEEK